jgi:hypothetical protein
MASAIGTGGDKGDAVAASRASLSATLYPQTPIEAAAHVTPLNSDDPSGPARYGAIGNASTNDQPAWAKLGKVGDYHFVPWLTYLVTSKIQISASVTLVGASRGATIQGAGFADYVVEIGDSTTGPNPQAGAIQRLKIQGTAGNKGLLHLQPLAHMWHIEDLLLYYTPCPALVIDGCWDSNYENIDIILCGGTSGVPANDCAVIVRNGCNNLYFRSLRIEQAAHGSIYVGDDRGPVGGAGPIYLLHGKVDLGYIKQHAPAVTVTRNGALICASWGITGINMQPAFSIQGGLTLRAGVTVAGGSGVPAIQDTRAWSHVDTATYGPGAAQTAARPYIPMIDLGDTQFSSATIYINQITPAVIQSKIFPIRILRQLTITANGGPGENTFSVFSSFKPAAGYPYVGCYLVNNNIGTQPGGRRKILASFPSGQFILQGTVGVTLGSDYSIEYCGGHYTPIQAEAVQMSNGMDLFAVLQTGATINGKASYTPIVESELYGGCTTFKIRASAFPAGTDATGYYLIDEQTGEPFLIGYGVDAATGRIGVLYDRAAAIDAAHTFSIVAGYYAGISQRGNFYEWVFGGERHAVTVHTADQLGFDPNNIPLWAFGTTAKPVNLPFSASISIDASSSKEFVITVTATTAFTINSPINLSRGSRLLLIVRNASGGALGAVTWNGIFKMAAWTSPEKAFSRSIEFMYDGASLIEINRTPADVPN